MKEHYEVQILMLYSNDATDMDMLTRFTVCQTYLILTQLI